MKDQKKTKKQLIEELEGLRQPIKSLKGLKTNSMPTESALIHLEREEQIIHDSLIELNGKPTALSVGRDITDRKQTEEALKERERTLSAFLAASPIGIGLAQNRMIKWGNKKLYDMLGYEDGTLVDKNVRVLYPNGEEYERVDHELNSRNQEGNISCTETRLVNKDGNILDCFIQASLLDPSDSSKGTIVALMDITERKKAETAFKKSEALMRRILNASIDRIRHVDQDLRIIWANKATIAKLNETLERILGQTCYKLFTDGDTPCEECPTIKAKETGQIERAVIYKPTVRGITGDSYWDIYSVPLKNEVGEIDGFIQISRNITEEKKAEDLIRNFSQQLLQTQEGERRMISYELHDRIAQDLSTIKIGFDTLFDGQPVISQSLRQKNKILSDVIEKAINSVRDLSYELRPPGLDEMDIVKALEIYSEDFSKSSKIRIDFQSIGMKGSSLDSENKIHLYRLVQEGLSNIRKHANAGTARVKIVGASPNIMLHIEDNGIGFDIKERERKLDNKKRLGLRSMRERVNLLGGQMRIKSRLKEGTKIFIKFPFKEKTGDPEETHINR
jgi:PAS domain S-box-containing protein